ncbi:MAG: hypothetical protein LBV30_03565, partial [Propionibacteriaceae bacterium]|nr:hypothetical protein [Propionibacteriaceae bacterium]
ILGAQVVALMDVTPETRALLDLGLSSLDMLRLVEVIDDRYGVAESLLVWISGLEMSAMGALTVGDIVEFVIHAAY